MGTANERPSADLIGQLFREPYKFDFYQAVRLLEHAARTGDTESRVTEPIGYDHDPGEEVVRFRAMPSLTFPSGDIAALERPAEDEGDRPAEMMVAFMGLTGPAGVLPQHYTSMVIERSHARHKDRTLLEFFDLFNHRTISLFFRAWEKYRYPFAYERHQSDPDDEGDLFSFCMFSLIGLAQKSLRNRFLFDDQLLLYYGGLFAQQPRSAISLRRMLSEHIGADVEIIQFQGQWLYLDVENQSCMPSAQHPDGLNTSLGVSTVVGSRVWDIQSRFRIRFGPLSLIEFSRMMPDGARLRRLSQLIRFYVGPEFDFDVQLVLARDDVPECFLGAPGAGAQLGWSTWIQSGEFEDDVDDAVFRMEGD